MCKAASKCNNIYISILLCLTSLSLPDMIGQFSKNPGKKWSQRFLTVSEMSRLRYSEITNIYKIKIEDILWQISTIQNEGPTVIGHENELKQKHPTLKAGQKGTTNPKSKDSLDTRPE